MEVLKISDITCKTVLVKTNVNQTEEIDLTGFLYSVQLFISLSLLEMTGKNRLLPNNVSFTAMMGGDYSRFCLVDIYSITHFYT
ncbi:MAG: hypothetical protein PHW91_04640 [Bacteroidales bacterium]|nr:hypothetical protein [Bacteroidales bacterium]